jgi:hypothetical protein
MGVILDIKYGVDGELEKYKCRNCIKGHPGNVTRGVHYTETFSAAPDMISSRMIGVIAMRNKMKRIAWDVNTAYLNSECAPSERVPLRYPPEFREYRTDENGKKHEIYGLLLSPNCEQLPGDRARHEIHGSLRRLTITGTPACNAQVTSAFLLSRGIPANTSL